MESRFKARFYLRCMELEKVRLPKSLLQIWPVVLWICKRGLLLRTISLLGNILWLKLMWTRGELYLKMSLYNT